MSASSIHKTRTRQPRVTPRSHGPLIIEAGWAQTRVQRRASRALAATGWLAWVGLWLPLVTLLVWLFFGTQLAMPVWLETGLYLPQVLGPLGVGLALAAVLAVWVLYERLRFGRKRNRRRRTRSVQAAELARDVGLPEPALRKCWRRRRVVVHYDERGVPVVFEATQRMKQLRKRVLHD